MNEKKISHVFKELGETLRKNRVSSGFSIEQVYEKTHIGIETIDEIENGRMPSIPTIYLRDFIIRYAIFLGIRNSMIVESFLMILDRNEKKIPKIKRENNGRKPVKIILILMIPVLLIIIFIQVLLIRKQQSREIVQITNKGNVEAFIQINDKSIPLKPNETVSFKDDFSGKIINTEKSLIMVEYYEDKWEVFFKEFEVLIKNGQDS